MKKRLFFGFAFFVGFSLLVAWQFAAAELADLQSQNPNLMQTETTDLASAKVQNLLFI